MPAKPEIDLVRDEVRNVLESSPAWRRLDPNERSAFAQNMVKVGHFLAKDPGWLDSKLPVERSDLAEALGPIDDLKKRLAQAPGQVGQDFEAGAMRQGVQEFANLVQAVDFPDFVASLVQGVFQAVVDASIQQMEAYGELLAATAKSVDQFAQDHISDEQVREQVASQHPSLLRIVRTSEGTSQLAPQEGADDMSALEQVTNSSEVINFSDPAEERKFIAAAKLEMARQRQKLMALMVMLGINRIIVTDGRINAKVVFDIEASDYAKRRASAGLTDVSDSESMGVGFTALPWGGTGGYRKNRHKTTVRSSVDDNSESKAQMKAQLTGDVRVNFRSETLPPERMLDALQFEQMNHLSGTVAGSGEAGAQPPANQRPGGAS
jgi:hypothetical protein